MNVTFGENYWGSRRRGNASEKIMIEKKFTWAGRDWRIPAVYVCEEGLVIDYCVRIPVEEIAPFLERWRPRIYEELSDEEQERAERESPFRLEFRDRAVIGGEQSPGSSGCGTSWYPPHLHDEDYPEAAGGVEEDLMEVYACDRTCGWKFWRTSFVWPEGVDTLDSLEIILKKEPVCYPGPHFKTGPGTKEKMVEFVHPGTGIKHVLTVHGWEANTLPEHVTEPLSSGRMKIIRTPKEFVTLQYSVEPDIPQAELRIQDCAPSDFPVMEKKGAAGSVAVIGGASGATSIFVAGKRKGGRPEWRSAMSSLHYEPVEDVEWRMQIYVKDEQEMRVEVGTGNMSYNS